MLTMMALMMKMGGDADNAEMRMAVMILMGEPMRKVMMMVE